MKWGPAGLACLTLVLPPAPLRAQQPGEASADVFRRFADRVVKVEVVETGSGGKASLGTAFFVSADGLLVTNYHVVAELIHDPERYRVQWIATGGAARSARVVALDVVADLAVLATDRPAPAHFAIDAPTIPKGTRLYSLGHPRDLGLSIVDGTYNGLLEHTLYPKIHFTGPLNPGMSGGPALTADGRVIGVNVSTEGNSVSFLVPAARARALVDRARTEPTPPADLLATVGDQVLANQDVYLASLFTGEDHSVRLGPFEVPTQPAPFFRCWGDAERADDALYERVAHECSTDDYIFLGSDQSSGIVSLRHLLLTSRGMGPVRFYAIYSTLFAHRDEDDELDTGTEVTDERCRTGNVRQQGIVLRTIFCARRYLDFPDLYDATIRAAVLGARDVGLITTLSLSGVSFANAQRIGREYLSRIRWASR